MLSMDSFRVLALSEQPSVIVEPDLQAESAWEHSPKNISKQSD